METVDVKAAHQKFKGEIVETPCVHLVVLVLGGEHPLDDDALNRLGRGVPPVPLGRVLRIAGQGELQMTLDQRFQAGDRGVDTGLKFGK